MRNIPAPTSVPAHLVPCTVCNDPVWVYADNDDAICHFCFRSNFAGALHLEHPPIAPLADIPAVRRRELQTLNRQRWPLTSGASYAIPSD